METGTTNSDTLTEQLRSSDEEVRRQAVMGMAGRPLAEIRSGIFLALGDSSWRVRKEAVDLLLGSTPDDGVMEELVLMLRSHDNAGLRNSAVETLERLGRLAVPCLSRHINDDDHDVRKFVIDIMGSIGDATPVPLLISALDDGDPNVSAAAAENLGKIGDPRAVSPLVQALGKQDIWLSYTILEALGKIGRPLPMGVISPLVETNLLKKAVFDCLGAVGDAEATPLLVEGLKEKVRNAREAAALAIFKVRGRLNDETKRRLDDQLRELTGSPFVDGLLASFETAEKPLKEALVMLFGLIGDERAVGPLLQACRDDRLRRNCIQAFTCMGEAGTALLVREFAHAGDEERCFIAYVCGELRYKGCAAILVEGMGSGNPVLRRAAVLACGKTGLTEMVGTIAGLLDDSEPEVREGAIDALARLAEDDRASVLAIAQKMAVTESSERRRDAVILYAALREADRLALLMKDEDMLVRRNAVTALASLRLPESASHFVKALMDEEPDVRIAAAGALGELGGAECLEPLLLTLRDEDPWVKCTVLKSLGKIGGERALGAVMEAMDGADGLIMISALEALSFIGGDAALKQVRRTLDDPDEEVVKSAIEILAGSDESILLASSEKILAHPHWDVRSTFIRTLAARLGEQALPYLEKALEIETDDLVKGQIQDIMGRFK
ncbi:HEAT repeat domain-containing protein [Geobacter sp. AOG1]|uniref:HEAT repeat domain-containing protein n=1 Tax=Geobacter sp. AOG1 TaxID=1566346 RepID=UPI001CC38C3D|nr:HEAT repeat domain-containing protein [Geobacter sp. AOG1]